MKTLPSTLFCTITVYSLVAKSYTRIAKKDLCMVAGWTDRSLSSRILNPRSHRSILSWRIAAEGLDVRLVQSDKYQ